MDAWINNTFKDFDKDKITKILEIKKDIRNIGIESTKKFEEIKAHDNLKNILLKELDPDLPKASIVDWDEEIEKLKTENIKEQEKISQERPADVEQESEKASKSGTAKKEKEVKKEIKKKIEKEVEKKVEEKLEKQATPDSDAPKAGEVEIKDDEVTYSMEEPAIKDWQLATIKAEEKANYVLQSSQLDPDKPIKHTDIDVYDGVAFVDTLPIFLLP